ncbi:hypothetical protein L1887_17801 [Cichorium endivia]|nr:hypothetical protein L1887_17801 [Cichorium endivia]
MYWCTYILSALNKRVGKSGRLQIASNRTSLCLWLYLLDKSDATYTVPAIRYLTKKLLLDRKKDHLRFNRKEDLNDIKSEQVKCPDDGEKKSEEVYLQTIQALVTEAYTHYPNSEKLKVLQTTLHKSSPHKSSPLSHHTPPSHLFSSPPKSAPPVQKTESLKRESPLVLEEQPKYKRPRGRPYGGLKPKNVKMVASEVSDPNSTLKSLAPSQKISTNVVPEYFKWLEIRNKKAPDSFLNCYFFHPYFYTKVN